jgi:hypothetical protein
MAGEMIRLVPKPEPGQQQVWPGRMGNNSDYVLQVRTSTTMVLDDGQPFDMPFEVTEIPMPSELLFDSNVEHEVQVFAVATRRMPNDATRWHRQTQPGFPDGDVPVMEPEVGSELYALRDYVNPDEDKHPEPDGLGALLNLKQLVQDAARRARVLRDRLGVLVGGAGTAIGTGLIQDLNHPSQAITSLVLLVDGVVVTTQIVVGVLDDEAARDQRSQVRKALRKLSLGGKVLA